jgi:hypothetical protein
MTMEERTVSRRRRVAFTVCSIVFAVAIGLGLFAVVSLVIGWFEGGDRLIHRVHDLGYGVWGGILLVVGLIALSRRPERRPAALQQLLVGIAAYWIAVLLAVDFEPGILGFALIFGVVAVVLVWLYPADRAQLAHAGRPSVVLVLLTLLAAVPLILYVIDMAALQRAGPPSDAHVEEHHWTTMASMALGILLVAGLAALRPPGWQIPAWSAGAAAFVFGLASVVFPAYPGSVGRAWGLTAMAGGILFVAAAEWEARRAAGRMA